jgi:hypothetical protein
MLLNYHPFNRCSDDCPQCNLDISPFIPKILGYTLTNGVFVIPYNDHLVLRLLLTECIGVLDRTRFPKDITIMLCDASYVDQAETILMNMSESNKNQYSKTQKRYCLVHATVDFGSKYTYGYDEICEKPMSYIFTDEMTRAVGRTLEETCAYFRDLALNVEKNKRAMKYSNAQYFVDVFVYFS